MEFYSLYSVIGSKGENGDVSLIFQSHDFDLTFPKKVTFESTLGIQKIPIKRQNLVLAVDLNRIQLE